MRTNVLKPECSQCKLCKNVILTPVVVRQLIQLHLIGSMDHVTYLHRFQDNLVHWALGLRIELSCPRNS